MRNRLPAFLFIVMATFDLAVPEAFAQRYDWDGPVGTVMRPYHDFAFQAVIDQNVPYDDVLNQPSNILERYFDDDLIKLILADRKCAVALGGICNIDWMVIWDSQDATGASVEIKAAGSGSDVSVTLNYPGFPPASMMYRIVRTKRGYRIHDIQTRERSLVSVLNGTWHKR